MSLPLTDAAEAPLGPAAAVASLPNSILPLRMAFTPFSLMMRSKKSLEEPPTCSPALTPLMEYIAGADHFPVELMRQTIGPRPPLPPMPNPNFLTFGRTMTQSALAITSDGMFWSLSIFCSTLVAFFRVSWSFSLLPAHTGRANATTNIETSQMHTDFLRIHAPNLANTDVDIALLLRATVIGFKPSR